MWNVLTQVFGEENVPSFNSYASPAHLALAQQLPDDDPQQSVVLEVSQRLAAQGIELENLRIQHHKAKQRHESEKAEFNTTFRAQAEQVAALQDENNRLNWALQEMSGRGSNGSSTDGAPGMISESAAQIRALQDELEDARHRMHAMESDRSRLQSLLSPSPDRTAQPRSAPSPPSPSPLAALAPDADEPGTQLDTATRSDPAAASLPSPDCTSTPKEGVDLAGSGEEAEAAQQALDDAQLALEQEKSRRAEAESALALARSEWAEEKRSLEAAVESHEARRAAAWRDASDANTRVEAAQTRAQVAEEQAAAQLLDIEELQQKLDASEALVTRLEKQVQAQEQGQAHAEGTMQQRATGDSTTTNTQDGSLQVTSEASKALTAATAALSEAHTLNERLSVELEQWKARRRAAVEEASAAADDAARARSLLEAAEAELEDMRNTATAEANELKARCALETERVQQLETAACAARSAAETSSTELARAQAEASHWRERAEQKTKEHNDELECSRNTHTQLAEARAAVAAMRTDIDAARDADRQHLERQNALEMARVEAVEALEQTRHDLEQVRQQAQADVIAAAEAHARSQSSVEESSAGQGAEVA
eukprot:g1447.t1